MKKSVFLLCVQLFVWAYSYAQIVPRGMNYQAVARNTKGELITNQRIELKIVLFSAQDQKRKDHYSEIHQVSTNELGLFNLIIGEGIDDQGQYGLIPWNTQNIWLEVSMKDQSKLNFITVSNSKLQAVPYAIHSSTANKLAKPKDSKTSSLLPPEPGVISTLWSVLGNAKTDASGNIFRINSLGTSDYVDLIMITDNVERLRIFAGGEIITKLNFEVGKNLNVGQNLYVVGSATICDSLIVKQNVMFNSLGGSTFNTGPFTVANLSPTLLTGTLTVDRSTDLHTALNVDKSTNLNSRLNVNKQSPTLLTGTLVVDSTTNLNGAINVNNIGPSYLSGTLRVDSCATFINKVKITSGFQTDTSGLFPSGSLQVGGGAYIKRNFYVGGIAKFGGPVAFGGMVTIQDGTQSTDPMTGALKVAGGVGIGLNLNVGGASTLGGMLTVKSLTESLDTTTGALKVMGGVGIRKRLNVKGATSLFNTLEVNGITSLHNQLNVVNSNSYIASFTNTTNQNGLSIQVNNAAPGWSNNYMEFRNGSGGVVGRIEGENNSQYTNNPNYIRELEVYNTGIEYASVVVAQHAINLAMAIVGVVAASTSTTLCTGFGICFTTPIISLIVVAGIELAIRIAAVVAVSVILVKAVLSRDDFVSYKAGRVGVTYESGAGDYAEWLPKNDLNESFLPGHIVGLKNGQISLNTSGADKLLVISSKPLVLGNQPLKDAENQFERVAFMGQVPVRVLGKVNVGDYILPEGKNNGLGRAVAPSKMKVEDYSKIVGVAWSPSINKSYNMINVAVGLNAGDISNVVIDQKNMINSLETEFNESNQALANMVPGFKNAASSLLESTNQNKEIVTQNNSIDQQDVDLIDTYSKKMDFLEISSKKVDEVLKVAEQTFLSNGGNIESSIFWNKVKNDPGYKSQLNLEVQRIYKNEIQNYLSRLKSRQ